MKILRQKLDDRSPHSFSYIGYVTSPSDYIIIVVSPFVSMIVLRSFLEIPKLHSCILMSFYLRSSWCFRSLRLDENKVERNVLTRV